MKPDLKSISIILILFLISITVVSAEDASQMDNNISETEFNVDEIKNTPAVEPTGFYELQQQIWRAEPCDTIELDNDYASDGVKTEITIDRTITLDGKGHTLDGNNSAIFYIKKGIQNVVFKDITFINGEKACGGAIFADNGTDYLTITNCTFKNNRATTSNVGGAVYIKASYCTITNNAFVKNTARTSGGAIRIEGNSQTITNNVFSENTATGILGGAICALGHNIKITDNTFKKNTAGRDGGAICIEGTVVGEIGTGNIISNNVFDSNKVTGNAEGCHGGAINIAGKDCTISDNIFKNNHADDIGGAIRWNGPNSNSGMITKNIFEGNYANSGGAIYVAGSGITIFKNTFKNNKAVAKAGGTLNIKGNSAVISDNQITKSSSKTSGGAIYIEGKYTKLINNNIAHCSAGDAGGAAYIKGAFATVKGNKFIKNNAGQFAGALLLKSGNALIKNNEFAKNTAKLSGGAAYITASKSTLTRNTFTKNKAGSENIGGGLRWSGDYATITKNTFTKNSAKTGFAYYGSGENVKITGNTYTPKKSNTERWEQIKSKITNPTVTFKKSAKTKKVIIVLKSKKNKALYNKKITLKVNGRTYKAVTNAKGQAVIKIKLNKKGTYKYKVQFAGDINYYGISKNGKIRIK